MERQIIKPGNDRLSVIMECVKVIRRYDEKYRTVLKKIKS